MLQSPKHQEKLLSRLKHHTWAVKSRSVNRSLTRLKHKRISNAALAPARQQQEKCWELRAARSMARLWREQGKPQQARELLAPVYGWFTQGVPYARPQGG
jgi:hypothetical protein